MSGELLLSVNEWVIAVVLLVLLLLAAEVGFRQSRKLLPNLNDAVITQVATKDFLLSRRTINGRGCWIWLGAIKAGRRWAQKGEV